jgi:hypothetical protein
MTWYSLQIFYDGETPGSVETATIKNLDGAKLEKARYSLFDSGLYISDPKHPATQGEIISPYRLRKILVFMQREKFE